MVGLVDAAEMIKNYTILLKKALDDSNPEKKSAWDEAVGMSLEKDKLLTAANEAYGNAKNALVIALQAVEGGRQNAKTRFLFVCVCVCDCVRVRAPVSLSAVLSACLSFRLSFFPVCFSLFI